MRVAAERVGAADRGLAALVVTPGPFLREAAVALLGALAAILDAAPAVLGELTRAVAALRGALAAVLLAGEAGLARRAGAVAALDREAGAVDLATEAAVLVARATEGTVGAEVVPLRVTAEGVQRTDRGLAVGVVAATRLVALAAVAVAGAAVLFAGQTVLVGRALAVAALGADAAVLFAVLAGLVAVAHAVAALGAGAAVLLTGLAGLAQRALAVTALGDAAVEAALVDRDLGAEVVPGAVAADRVDGADALGGRGVVAALAAVVLAAAALAGAAAVVGAVGAVLAQPALAVAALEGAVCVATLVDRGLGAQLVPLLVAAEVVGRTDAGGHARVVAARRAVGRAAVAAGADAAVLGAALAVLGLPVAGPVAAGHRHAVVDLGVDAAGVGLARVRGAVVLVVARHRVGHALAGLGVAPVVGAGVAVVAVHVGVRAVAGRRVAGVVGAGVGIVTVHRRAAAGPLRARVVVGAGVAVVAQGAVGRRGRVARTRGRVAHLRGAGIPIVLTGVDGASRDLAGPTHAGQRAVAQVAVLEVGAVGVGLAVTRDRVAAAPARRADVAAGAGVPVVAGDAVQRDVGAHPGRRVAGRGQARSGAASRADHHAIGIDLAGVAHADERAVAQVVVVERGAVRVLDAGAAGRVAGHALAAGARVALGAAVAVLARRGVVGVRAASRGVATVVRARVVIVADDPQPSAARATLVTHLTGGTGVAVVAGGEGLLGADHAGARVHVADRGLASAEPCHAGAVGVGLTGVVATGVSTRVATGVSARVAARVAAGVSTRVAAGVATGVVARARAAVTAGWREGHRRGED